MLLVLVAALKIRESYDFVGYGFSENWSDELVVFGDHVGKRAFNLFLIFWKNMTNP